MTRQAEGPNHELFVKVLAQIEREPQRWVQGAYRCETGQCFAGWAGLVSGLRWTDDFSSWFVNENGVEEHAATVAARLLGLPWSEDYPLDMDGKLFHAENQLDDLYRISADLLGLDETVLRDKVASEVSS